MIGSLSAEFFRKTSIYYVMAGLDPATHAVRLALKSDSFESNVQGRDRWNRVDHRIKSSDDDVCGKYLSTDGLPEEGRGA